MLKRLTTPSSVRAFLLVAVAVVFLRPLSAQMPAATVESLTGQVSVLQDPNNLSSASALFAGGQIKARQMVITGPGSYAKFVLADGSYFEVFENSKVQFHEDFGWTNLLNIVIGHIKVFIDHSKGPNPNSVATPTAVISVRGTIFDIDVQDNDGTTLVTLEEGWVHVRNVTSPGSPERDLRLPGEHVTVFRGQGLMGKQNDPNGLLQKAIHVAEDTVRVLAQQRVPIGGVGGAPGGPTVGGVGGAQGDKGKGGAAPAPPPAAPPSTTGH